MRKFGWSLSDRGMVVDLLMTSAMVRVGRGVCARVRAGLWNWVNFERGKKIGLGGFLPEVVLE